MSTHHPAPASPSVGPDPYRYAMAKADGASRNRGPVPITSRMPALGWFRSITTRDGNALARDGEEVVAANEVVTGDLEVQFRDGTWILCEPSEFVANAMEQ